MIPRATLVLALVLLVFLSGCTSFSLSKQSGPLAISRHEQATEKTLAVLRFEFEDDTIAAFEDRAKWQQILAAGLGQSNVFETVREASVLDPEFDGYVLTGKVRRFTFEKNWVPTFFPFHVALSFFTLGGYTIFGGPTTGTAVRITVDFQLEDADGRPITAFTENYASTRAVNIYTSDAKNPYDNPNLALSRMIDSTAAHLAAALSD